MNSNDWFGCAIGSFILWVISFRFNLWFQIPFFMLIPIFIIVGLIERTGIKEI